ncbi:MAG: hypothetical protein E7591_04825 [Ruminococcaceae bacterium]|nr:hypothetical protein [Oscillospiraceae bacterium]
MNKLIKVFLFLISILLAFSSCNSNSKVIEQCDIVEEESWFNEAYTKGDKIYYSTYVTVKNTSKNDVTIKLVGDLSKERDNGRVKEERITAVDKNGISKFEIKSKESVSLELLFIGTLPKKESKDSPLKEDRLLFPIDIKIA